MRRLLVLGVFLLGLPTPARADDPRQRAEQLEADAQRTPDDRGKAAACGTAWLDLYNAAPDAPGGDEQLYRAAVCFDRAASPGGAMTLLAMLRRSHPRSPLAARALLLDARLNARVAIFDRAAALLEEYAAKYAGEADAPAALGDAVMYRLAFGPLDKAEADAKLFARLWGAKRPAEAAKLVLALTPGIEARGRDAVIAHLRDYLRRFAAGADRDDSALALGRLGEELWHRACPAPEVDGLCVRVERERATQLRVRMKQAKPTRCGGPDRPRVTAIARDAALVREARAALEAVVKHVEQATAAPDPRVVAVAGRARVWLADRDLEAFLAVAMPAKLDFTPGRRAANEASAKQFDSFLRERTQLGGAATRHYEAAIAAKEPAATIAAVARLGQLAAAFADTLATAELPVDVRSGPSAGAKIEAFCDRMTEVSEPLEARAVSAFFMCSAKSTELSIDNEYTGLCLRELARLDPTAAMLQPGTAPVIPRPLVTALEGPPSLASPPAGYTAALARYTTAFSPATCRAIAGDFAKLALAEAHYMAGLALHRCGFTDDATRAYRAALAARAGYAPALSNLAELEWRRGQRAAAKQGWEAALAALPKLYGARLGLAAVEAAELVTAPGDRKRIEAATFQLRSALGVDAARPEAYGALAALELGRSPAALAYYVREALARGPEATRIAGLVHATPDPWRAHDYLAKALAAEPGDAEVRFAAGVVALRRRQFSDALAVLARLPASYDVHVARGLAHHGNRKPADAIAAYDAAIALAPARAEAHYNQAIVHEQEAAAATDRAVARAALVKAIASYRRAAAATVPAPAMIADANASLAQLAKALAQLDAAIARGDKP